MSDLHLTSFDPDDLAAKTAEIMLQSLEPRLQRIESQLRALEHAVKEREQSEYLSAGEVHRRFTISSKTLKKIVSAGFIKRYDAGSHGRYRADEIERYLARYHVNGRKNGRVNGIKKAAKIGN